MENITLRFNVEIDGETFAKVAKCIKVHEPEIFSKMVDEFKPCFDKILNGETLESEITSEKFQQTPMSGELLAASNKAITDILFG